MANDWKQKRKITAMINEKRCIRKLENNIMTDRIRSTTYRNEIENVSKIKYIQQ